MTSENLLSLDFGTKNIGVAYSVNGIISPLPVLRNDSHLFENIQKLVIDLNISKIYVGVSEGRVAKLTLRFVSKLYNMLKLPVETVEEAVSTIEATDILKENHHNRRHKKSRVDSVSAAVILRRIIS